MGQPAHALKNILLGKTKVYPVSEPRESSRGSGRQTLSQQTSEVLPAKRPKARIKSYDPPGKMPHLSAAEIADLIATQKARDIQMGVVDEVKKPDGKKPPSKSAGSSDAKANMMLLMNARNKKVVPDKSA